MSEITIVDHDKLTIDLMLESNKPIFSKSEIEEFDTTPYLLNKITRKKYERNNDFFREIGMISFLSSITLDNTLMNTIEKKENIEFSDINIESKIKRLNELSELFNLEPINETDPINTLYACKIRGLQIANSCVDQLHNETKEFEVNSKSKIKTLDPFVKQFEPILSLIKGSYIEKDKKPNDIDLVIILDGLFNVDYLKFIKIQEEIDNIPIKQIIIPKKYLRGYTYFDLDVNPNSEFIYGNETIYLSTENEKMIKTYGLISLYRIRKMISKLKDKDNLERRFKSKIRQPEILYKHLRQNDLGHLVQNYKPLEYKFSDYINQLKTYLAQSSIQLSEIIKKIK